MQRYAKITKWTKICARKYIIMSYFYYVLYYFGKITLILSEDLFFFLGPLCSFQYTCLVCLRPFLCRLYIASVRGFLLLFIRVIAFFCVKIVLKPLRHN